MKSWERNLGGQNEKRGGRGPDADRTRTGRGRGRFSQQHNPSAVRDVLHSLHPRGGEATANVGWTRTGRGPHTVGSDGMGAGPAARSAVSPGGRWIWNEEFTFSSLCRTSVATPAAGKGSTPTALSPARSGGGGLLIA
eukprot:gene7655-biopygen12073